MRPYASGSYNLAWDMLTRAYVEALLVDKQTADRVWELWNGGLITDRLAKALWLALLGNSNDGSKYRFRLH